jgi:DNA-binding transcriptional MocR family regulator
MKRYERLASQIGDLIQRGDLLPGTRIPAVRAACDAYGVSPSTVFRAYYLLESQGLIVARPRSGYFVSAAAPGAPLQGAASTPNEASKSVKISELVFEVLHSMKDTHTVALGSAFMSPMAFPMQRLGRSCASVNRSTDLAKMVAALPPGDDALRRQIALRYLMNGMVVHVDEIIITSGALDALTLSLQVLTRAGDEIADGHAERHREIFSRAKYCDTAIRRLLHVGGATAQRRFATPVRSSARAGDQRRARAYVLSQR